MENISEAFPKYTKVTSKNGKVYYKKPLDTNRSINGQSRREFPGKTGIPDGNAILTSRTGILRVPVTIKRDYREF